MFRRSVLEQSDGWPNLLKSCRQGLWILFCVAILDLVFVWSTAKEYHHKRTLKFENTSPKKKVEWPDLPDIWIQIARDKMDPKAARACSESNHPRGNPPSTRYWGTSRFKDGTLGFGFSSILTPIFLLNSLNNVLPQAIDRLVSYRTNMHTCWTHSLVF